ncbi:single-stranded DNA-binding protein [Cytobacillus oceanisediminis]|uniref:single-stranded DNA-binding protein n=1 Tax=Cytobacillus oceanisediminis TaxID=665099 RepID=UPI001C24B7F2|nr:single-stranded DNA-binding protein [Cytobacillus oceanisediminis]MBU8770312.1 single-stranded DNA-binding protein [Cytobacillus oceanisediminis]
MNVIVLTGNATKEVEIRYNQKGTPIANGTIAVRRDFKNQQGEYESDFFNFVVIGKLGEVIANHVKKGDKFGIRGRLQNRVWDSDNGKKYFTEVVVEGFDFPSKTNNSPGSNNSNRGASEAPQTRIDSDPFANDGQIDISDDDLPF